MSMEPSSISDIATPQGHGSPKKQRNYQYQIRTSSENMQAYTMGEKRVHEEVQRRGRPDAQADIHRAGSSNARNNERVSTSSTGSSDTERTGGELAEKLGRRRKVVDEQGCHFESPSLDKSSAMKDQRDSIVAKTLFADKEGTPEKSPDKEMLPELKTTPPRPSETPPRTPRDSQRGTEEEEEESRRTPTRRGGRRTSRQKLLDAAASKLSKLTDEQLTSLTVLMGASTKTDDVSNCSSSERSSEDSPPSSNSKTRATSAPAGIRAEFFETTPQYPELRKKRLSGQRPVTPMKVRFEGEEEELNGSDDDIPTATSSIGVRAARRLSRGPTGEIVPVSHDDSPTKSDDTENRELTTSASEVTLSEAASAAVDGAKGAVWGGVTGAAVGVTGALFTFGLSIPVCAVAGATYHGYNRIVSNLEKSRGRENTSDSSNVRTSSAPQMSARRQ